MKLTGSLSAALGLALVGGCYASNQETSSDVSLRNLTEKVATPVRDRYPIEGDLIPTPSDAEARYYLLQHRKPLGRDTIYALLREERGAKAAYARIEVHCGKRLFHIVGIGNRRSFAQTSMKSDGDLRKMDRYPLRREIASFVCNRSGTPLAKIS